MATRSGSGSSSIFVRKMVADSGQASEQLEAQTRPIGAENGQHQRLRTDQNPIGAMPVEQVGQRDAHGLRRRATGKAGVTRLVIMMGLKIATYPFSSRVSTAPNGLFNGLIWPKNSAMRFDRFSATASSQLSSPDGKAAIPRGTRKFLLCCPAPRGGAPAFVSGRSIAIEAVMVRARKRKTET
ncbi:MAG TPA: hypothetical protein VNQ97_04255 [Burkholderiaceae bacterium]|nr:hypothetical protein [Burkholderiaceae bacterium]